MTRIARPLRAAFLLALLASGGPAPAAEDVDARILGMYDMMLEGEAARAKRRDPAATAAATRLMAMQAQQQALTDLMMQAQTQVQRAWCALLTPMGAGFGPEAMVHTRGVVPAWRGRIEEMAIHHLADRFSAAELEAVMAFQASAAGKAWVEHGDFGRLVASTASTHIIADLFREHPASVRARQCRR